MKFPCTCLAAILFVAANWLYANPSLKNDLYRGLPYPSDDVVTERIARLDLPFRAETSATVKSTIRRFMVEGYRDSEDILGRSNLYFPIFEHYLRLHGLPESLKYLPIVESSLKANAQSPVGAAGLWQFVPATARLYGLTVNAQVDERLDPHKASEAAARMLSSLFEQFGDWGLVLAAYNCGPGRVRQAMRAANSSNYWKVREFLPAESQRYIPRFIAAAYLVQYYDAYGLVPDNLDRDLMNTRTFRISKSLHLNTIARQLGLSYRTLQFLNPSFIQGLVPATTKGHLITIPDRVATDFAAQFVANAALPATTQRQQSQYITVPGDNLETLATLFQCTPEDLMAWNGLTHRQLAVNQT
ncbi:MAG: transglycosylase SLT domain-containing protein [Saprospiraceae bacterium]